MRPLTPRERETYLRDGYLILRGLFSADRIADAARETEALLSREDLKSKQNIRARWQYHCETSEQVFELFDPIIDIAPRCRALAEDPALLGALEVLLGEPVHLIKDKLIYKPSGTYGYPLHQDYIAWTGFPTSFTTAVIALDASTAENGWIEVFPGAHAQGNLSDPDGNFHVLEEEQLAGIGPVPLDLAPGDVALYGGYMPHRSAPNRSASQRRHLLISYNAASDGGEQRAGHYQAFHHYLRSVYGAMGMGDLFFK